MKLSKSPKTSKKGVKKYLPKNIDLHIHTKYSDGELEVEEILNACHHIGLKAVSITDHDTIDAYIEGKELAEELKLEFIPGVELSSYFEGSEIHILGYLFDPTNLTLNFKLQELQQKRKIRAKKIVQKLNNLGIDISMERVFEKVRGTSVGRPHIAAVLVEEEYVSNFPEAFEKYLSAEFIKEFETEKLTPLEAIALIKEASGVSVLAHPAKTLRDDLIESFVQAGLAGIETYCHGVDRATVSKYRNLAKTYNLVCSGGSDFHNTRGGTKFGLGSIRVPYSSLQNLKKTREKTFST
jgi:predicted metal-dependent phosphoesterase TrpH